MIKDRFLKFITASASTKDEKRRFSIRLVEYAVRFLLGFILSGARVFGTLSPFAVGLVAASGGGGAVVTLVGAVSGYLFFGSFLWAIQYITAAVLVCTTIVAFRDTHVSESSWFMPVSAAVITTCVGFVSAAGGGWVPSVTALLITDIVLTGGCAYFFRRALNPWKNSFKYEINAETINAVSVLILLSVILISLSNITIFGIVSIGRTLAALCVFLAAYTGGVGMGCATGVAIGLAMDAASSGTPLFAAAYGFAGLTSGVFSKRSRLSFAVSFVLVGAAISLMSFGGAPVPALLYEVFAASVIFIILPNSFISRFAALLPIAGMSGSGVLRAREYTKARIDGTALAFKDLYTTVKEKTGISRNDEDLATVFDRAAETTCRKCGKSSVCWQTNYQTTLDVMNNLAPLMLERGSLSETDFPDYFWCVNLKSYVASVNAELRGLLYRRQYKNRLRENQNAAFNQYSDVSSILSEISVELGGGIKLEPELEERLSKYLQSLGFLAETAVFRTRGGRLIAEIVDPSAVSTLKKDPAYLDKLSAALGVRLCTDETHANSDRLKLLEAEPLSAAVGISCVKKSGQEVSGDKGAYFKTDEGILYVILSDGMGTGELAARCSGDTVRILERFLRSGVKAEMAMRMLNDLFLLKNEDDTGCATIDLVSIDLFSGKANMFKYGAAPSYLRHDDTVRRVRGKSLAVGLGMPPHNAPDHVKMELQPGSIAVMVSDGVISGAGDSWLEDIISDFEAGNNPRKLSKTIIDQAFRKYGKDDDMTVIAIQVSLRG